MDVSVANGLGTFGRFNGRGRNGADANAFRPFIFPSGWPQICTLPRCGPKAVRESTQTHSYSIRATDLPLIFGRVSRESGIYGEFKLGN
jgi:hypothetical protein